MVGRCSCVTLCKVAKRFLAQDRGFNRSIIDVQVQSDPMVSAALQEEGAQQLVFMK